MLGMMSETLYDWLTSSSWTVTLATLTPRLPSHIIRKCVVYHWGHMLKMNNLHLAKYNIIIFQNWRHWIVHSCVWMCIALWWIGHIRCFPVSSDRLWQPTILDRTSGLENKWVDWWMDLRKVQNMYTLYC